jgi:hypothetical protein
VADVSRSKTLDAYYLNNKINVDELTQEEIYKIEELNGKDVKQELQRDVFSKVKELKETEAVHNIFVMDKNYSPQHLIDTVEDAVNQNFTNPIVHHCVLMPESFGSSTGADFYFPFNFNILLISLIRSLWRKDHLTMKFGPIHSLFSFIGSIQAQKKDSFEERYPKERYTLIPIHYYRNETIVEGLKDPENQKLYSELHTLINELVEKKKSIPASADDVTRLVKPLIPLNTFVEFDDEYMKCLFDKIITSI